jgi:hypothetical protein
MTALPTADRLAALVSHVTETMVGVSFHPDNETAAAPPLTWRTAILGITGARPLTVGLSSSEDGCAFLCAKLFSVEESAVDESMVNDALGELLNMTAGLIRTHLKLDQALGLPRIIKDYEENKSLLESQALVLRADQVGLILWINEQKKAA